jgi:predicted NAD/FAD-binding protein
MIAAPSRVIRFEGGGVYPGMRIAIVGAGIAGLTCAHLLHPDHEITVFEAEARPGGHTRTVAVESDDGVKQVDTGFIVFNDRNYPGFERLLERLGVASQPSHMSFSVSDSQGDFEYNGSSLNGLFARRSSIVRPSFHRMVRDLLRFNREAPQLIGLNGSGPTLLDFLDEGGYSREFVERLIVPQASAVWSADPRELRSFPAGLLAEFFQNHGMFGLTNRPQWRTVSGGSMRYVERLTAPFRDRLRVGTRVARVERFADRVEVTPAAGSGPESFDEVILAAHSDQSLTMLADASPLEAKLLGAIPYQSNEVVLHTDTSLLPRRRRAWASWNFHLGDAPAERTTVTYHMNRLQALRGERELCVTLNKTDAIAEESIISARDFSHPVFTHAGLAAQSRWEQVSGVRRTHFCGAYWGYGFHEDGVQSALRVCERFGAAL